MSDVVDVLRKARKVIEDEKDWSRGDLCTADGRHCALGAIAVVLGYSDSVLRLPPDDGTHDVDWEALDEVYGVLDSHPAVIALSTAASGGVPQHGDRTHAVYLVNDREHHSVVLDLFDRAIEQAA